ncbi:alpha-dioxygenase 2-like [Stylophora pistillata]|uniref:alpha-dioxygenase 2-like n=1 Tax=Stylophora pistillata TaxID=50429 RepID=UPI000C044984|nr:alpha-dioxygenase 2-like [Stylophora pistillata]
MNPLIAKIVQLIQILLPQVKYWWKLPVVLAMVYQFNQRDFMFNNNLFDGYSLEKKGPKYHCQDPLIGHLPLGCVTKKSSPFPYFRIKDGLTIEECVNHCKDNRYAYAGFDHCRKCYCGDKILKYVECKKGKFGCGRSSQIKIFRTMFCTEEMKSVRTHDGTCNDLNHPASGSRYYRFGRNINRTKTFEDKNLLEPCPRKLSKRLMARDQFIPATTLNLLTVGFLQMMLHDWFDHGPVDTSRRINISLDKNDTDDQKFHGEFMRIPRTKEDNCKQYSNKDGAATFQNDNTHWWDGSQLYASDDQTNARLRSFEDGKMKVSDKDGLLPIDKKTGIDITGFSQNWWIGLSLLHNIFSLEHNSICDMLKLHYPNWDDQKLYDTARLINVAGLQKIHTVEWTPAVLNSSALRNGVYLNFDLPLEKEIYDWMADHKISVSASADILKPLVGQPSEYHGVPFSLTEEFVAVYRMHPFLPDDLYLRNASNGQRTGKSYSLPEYSFAGARKIIKESSMDDIVFTFGVEHPGALRLHNYPKHLMNLKLPNHQQDGETIDLATVDILRDRERGIPRYNEFRRLTNLAPAETFEKLTRNKQHQVLLKELYDGDIEKVDLLIGCLAEDPLPDGWGFGETAFNIFLTMASRRVQVDRFMTDNYNDETYSPEGLKWIKDTDMKKVLLRAFPKMEWLKATMAKTKNAFWPWPAISANSLKE